METNNSEYYANNSFHIEINPTDPNEETPNDSDNHFKSDLSVLNFNYISSEDLNKLKQKVVVKEQDEDLNQSNKEKEGNTNESKCSSQSFIEEMESKWLNAAKHSLIDKNTFSSVREKQNNRKNSSSQNDRISKKAYIPNTDKREKSNNDKEFNCYINALSNKLTSIKNKSTHKETNELSSKVEEISNILNTPLYTTDDYNRIIKEKEAFVVDDMKSTSNTMNNNSESLNLIYEPNRKMLNKPTFLQNYSYSSSYNHSINFKPFDNNIDNLVYETGKMKKDDTCQYNQEASSNEILAKINRLYASISSNQNPEINNYTKETKEQISMRSLSKDFNSIFNNIAPNTSFSKKNPISSNNQIFKKDPNMINQIQKETKILNKESEEARNQMKEIFNQNKPLFTSKNMSNPIKIQVTNFTQGNKSPKKIINSTRDSQIYLNTGIVSYESVNNPIKIYEPNNLSYIKDQLESLSFKDKLSNSLNNK